MKVIFLDFDGVLNSQGSFLYEDNRRKKHKEQGVKGPVQETLCNVNTANFQFVLEQYPDVKVVISSTWRNLFTLDWLKAKLQSYHIDSSRVIGITPEDTLGGDRGREIQWWLNKNPDVTHYVIIDDNDWGITAIHTTERFVHTSWAGGMNTAHVDELCEKLSNRHKQKIKTMEAIVASLPLPTPKEET